MRAVRLAQDHLEGEWMPLLDRIRASTALTGPCDSRSWFDDASDSLFHSSPDGRTVIAPIVDGFTAEERQFFDGFVTEVASSVAAELSHCTTSTLTTKSIELPDELRQLDDRGEWDWLARLYLIEQFHHMVDIGEVELAARRGSLLDRPARPHRDQLGS